MLKHVLQKRKSQLHSKYFLMLLISYVCLFHNGITQTFTLYLKWVQITALCYIISAKSAFADSQHSKVYFFVFLNRFLRNEQFEVMKKTSAPIIVCLHTSVTLHVQKRKALKYPKEDALVIKFQASVFSVHLILFKAKLHSARKIAHTLYTDLCVDRGLWAKRITLWV